MLLEYINGDYPGNFSNFTKKNIPQEEQQVIFI